MIAFDSRVQGQAEVFIIGAQGGQLRRLTEDPANDTQPAWSNDGLWLYFDSNRSGTSQVWKIPVSGEGRAEQVTRQGGGFKQISVDGEFLYYRNQRGLWRKPTRGGQEEELVEYAGQFEVVSQGAYFPVLASSDISRRVGRRAVLSSIPKDFTVRFLDFKTGKIHDVFTTSAIGFWGLTVSPDGRTLLFSQTDRLEADLMLVEDFH
jgi:Tol biopolymer transport system component